MHGFSHIEIPTTDPKKSKDFYGKLFGWKMDENMPGYVMFSTGDSQGGGLTKESKPSENGVILYIEVEDIPKKLGEIEAAGQEGQGQDRHFARVRFLCAIHRPVRQYHGLVE